MWKFPGAFLKTLGIFSKEDQLNVLDLKSGKYISQKENMAQFVKTIGFLGVLGTSKINHCNNKLSKLSFKAILHTFLFYIQKKFILVGLL